MRKIEAVLWTLTAIAIIMIFSFFGLNQERKIREEQLQELAVIYPEIADELQDNFAYYQKQSVHLELIHTAAVIFLMVVFGAVLTRKERREKKHDAAEICDEMEAVYEQLVSFQKGNFELLPFMEETDIADRYARVHEKLRELGCYFSDLKTRIAEEENSTKALITNISHQLKTPLASIRMSHELAQSPDLSENERADFLSAEMRDIRKMEILLDELVKLSRLENHMIQIKPEMCSIKQTISEAVSQIFMKAHEKNIEIYVDMEGDAQISHDRKWTVEAIANILENAVKYSGAATAVGIHVEYFPTGVLIEVEDEGIGIPDEELHEVFKRFYRGKKARELVNEGAGVGLYLARTIIGQQGGTIVAKRKFEGGTIFKIMLPLG